MYPISTQPLNFVTFFQEKVKKPAAGDREK
jgi:hypothetical protein